MLGSHGLHMSATAVDDAAALQAKFTAAVHRHHFELVSRGMPPNQACALALRVAAGQVSLPMKLSDIYAALATASQDGNYSDMCKLIRSYFASPDALYASFWPQQQPACAAQYANASSQQHQHLPGSADSSVWNNLHNGANSNSNISSATTNDSSNRLPSSSSSSPIAKHSSRKQQSQLPTWLQVDFAAVQELHDQLQSCKQESVRDALLEGSQQLLLHMTDACKQGLSNPGFCRQVCGLLANPWLEHLECHHLVAGIAAVLWELQQPQTGRMFVENRVDNCCYKGMLQLLFLSWRATEMRRAVGFLQQYITITLYQQQAIVPGIEAATKLLGLLEAANSSSRVLDATEFYNDVVNEPDFNIKQDYKHWMQHNHSFSFCSHAWIYDPASKSKIMQLENQMQQLQAFESSMIRAFMGGPAMPFLLLKVRRGPYLLGDTLLQINRAKNDGNLKKPLKVKFVGEEGVDEGGPQKEFFQLLVRQCFNPEFGMFVYSDETRLHWFHASNINLDTEFELIGILIGLAIYNSHILEFQFPMVLYKKLLGQPVGFDDLAELHPDVHRSLQRLAAMSAEELQGLGLTFQIETEGGFGERMPVDLQPDGGNIAVSADNVDLYCKLYTQHLLVGSINHQFDAFQRGFSRLCSGSALHFFRPAELEMLVCGGRVVDLSALQAATHYDDGYDEHSQPVQWFWEVAHALDDTKQKRLLFFITGSDRVPIKGLAHIHPPFVISRNGSDNSRLPTAHTCFNHLLLPAYKDKDTLTQRLLLAIENAEGFGLL